MIVENPLARLTRRLSNSDSPSRSFDVQVRRQLTPGPISSLRRTAGSPPFTSFSTSYGELDSVVRRPMLTIGKRREEYFAVAQAALLEAKHRKSIGNPGEKRLSPQATGQRAVRRHAGSNQRFPRCARQDCLPLGVHSSARRTRGWRKDEFSKCFAIREKIGGRDRVRTCDPLLAKQVLSQLSYTPTAATSNIFYNQSDRRSIGSALEIS